MKKATLKNKRLKIINLEQNSDVDSEWMKWRQEGIGASVGYDAINFSKALFDQFLNAKVPASIESMPAIIRGNKLEPEARELIEMEVMNSVVPVCAERGFLQASADGVERGMNMKITEGHEIKSPELKGHEKHLRGEVGHQKFHQLQQSMYVFGLKRWHFWSYCPEHSTPLHSIVVKRDDAYIANMEQKAEVFWQRVLDRSWPDAEVAGTALAAEMVQESGIEAPAIISNVVVPDELAQRTSNLIGAICSFKEVIDEDHASGMTDLLSASKNLLKSLDEKRLEIVQPHFDFKKEVDGMFKNLMDQIKQADTTGRKKLLAYKNEVERKQREAEQLERERLAEAERKRLAALEEAKEKGEEITEEDDVLEDVVTHQHEAVVSKPVEQTRGTFGSAGTRKKWVFEVTDVASIPSEYLSINERAINAEIKAQVAKGQTPVIAGVTIKQENILSVR